MTGRADFVDALAALDGVTASEFRPRVLATGMAWPQCTGHERLNNFIRTNWDVWLVLSKDEKAAAQMYDSLIADLWAALTPVIFVEKDEPVITPVTAAAAGPVDNIFAVTISGYSE